MKWVENQVSGRMKKIFQEEVISKLRPESEEVAARGMWIGEKDSGRREQHEQKLRDDGLPGPLRPPKEVRSGLCRNQT